MNNEIFAASRKHNRRENEDLRYRALGVGLEMDNPAKLEARGGTH